jgi:predicted nucleic acid-binding protein
MEEAERIRVFIDSTVLFSAALSASGAARELLLAGLSEERFLLSLSPLVLEETERNLGQQYPDTLPYLAVLSELLADSRVHPPAELVDRVARYIDPKDAPIVAGAITAGAEFLATFDRKHLLAKADVIARHFGIAVATPGDILAAERERQQPLS